MPQDVFRRVRPAERASGESWPNRIVLPGLVVGGQTPILPPFGQPPAVPPQIHSKAPADAMRSYVP
jgi:hypothetical protein